ncbi:MAG: proprotein convertase P-domain-containing protein, partial [Aureispira sp.]
MKILLQVLLRVSLLCLLILGTYSQASATHNLGCTITYECLGNNQYEFTMICYGDCAPGSASLGGTARLTFTSSTPGCAANPNFVTLDTIGHLSNVDVSQLCDPTVSTCQGGTQPGVEQFYYTGIATLPAGCIWTINYGVCCRSGSITNLQNPNGQGTFVSTTINTNVTPCNNSVQFTNVPIIYTCDSVLTFYNHGAFDPDGDTLIFSLANPLDDPAPGTAIPFVGGATITTPVLVEPTTTFQFDSTTGQMTFMPLDNTQQICMTSIKVEEIRNGVVIATTFREVQVVVLTNCSNDPPAVDSNGVQGTALTINGTDLELCRGTFGSFDLIVQDPNGDSLTVTSNIVTAIPGAVVNYILDTTRRDSVVLTFTINSINLTPGIYPFTITVNDNACPVPSLQFLGYALRVYGSNYTSNIYCRNDNDPVPIIIGDSSGIFRQLVTNPAGLVLDSITGIIDLDSSQLGTFDIVYTLDSIAICPSDSIQITIVDVPDPTFTYPMPLWCRQGADAIPVISGTPGGLFSSDPNLSIDPISGVVDVSSSSVGQHIIYYDVVGGTCSAQDSFIIDIMEIANFDTDASQYFICDNELDTIQLSTIITYNGTTPPIQNYSWSPNSNINSTTIPNPQVILLTPDTYVLTYNDSICPTQVDTVVIEAPYPVNILPTSDVVLCNGNSAQIGAAVAPGPGDRTFTHAGPNVIQTEATTTFNLNVSGVAPGTINDALLSSLGVCFDVNINSLGLITVVLEAPSGEQVVLTNRNGLFNSTLNGATFSAQAGNTLITSIPQFTPIPPNGNYFPQNGPSGFNPLLGATTNGIWRLIITHNNGGNSAGTGNLLDWCLNFQDLSTSSFVWSPNNATITCTACDSPTVSPSV